MTDLIIQKINEYFERGIVLNRETMDYFTSVTGLESLKDINTLESYEKETFLELVFFPDDDIRLDIEKILGLEVPVMKALSEIKGAVAKDKVSIIYKDDNFVVDVDTRLFSKFLDRLNLTNSMKRYLDIEMDDNHGVWLRNSRLAGDRRVLGFIRDLYSKKDKFIWFDDIFNLSLQVLKEYKDGDIINLFIEKKLFYATLIQKDMHFKELMKKHNMETLMMQGVSSVSVDVEDAFKKIKLINQINRVVFSYSNMYDHEHFKGEEMNIAEDVQDILDIFRK